MILGVSDPQHPLAGAEQLLSCQSWFAAALHSTLELSFFLASESLIGTVPRDLCSV